MPASITRLGVVCIVLAASCTSSEAPSTPVAKRSLSVALSGSGSGSIVSSPGGIDCGSDCSEAYDEGTVVTLTASPATGSELAGWSATGCSGTGSCSVTLSAPTSVTATFLLTEHVLSVVFEGSGAGTVASSPGGIACDADCSGTFAFGSTVTLTATPAPGSTFSGWSGAGCSGAGACAVSITAAASVTAIFALQQHALAVALEGSGAGTVASTPAGIDCGADCDESYDHGTVVTLSATPAEGAVFAGWSGGGCTGTDPCTVAVTAAMSVTATFTIAQHTLTAVRSGKGTGTVSSSPAGIRCPSVCDDSFDHGTAVTLTANPGSSSAFVGWSGGGCSGTGTCTVNMTNAITVTATFALLQYTVTAIRSGAGVGTVTSTPTGIKCGTDCTETYNHGTSVTMSAAPAVGSSFAGWSGGGCSGTGSCVITVTSAVAVTATFNDVAPTVKAFSPDNGVIGVAPEAVIAVKFSEPMDRAATEAAFSVTEPSGVTGTFSWSANTMTFRPDKAFLCGSEGITVRWGLSSAARDVAGNALTALSGEFRVIRCLMAGFFAQTELDGHVTNTGVVSVAGATFRVGDFANNTYARGFISFDFSTLPSDAVVTGGQILMYYTRFGNWPDLGQLTLEAVASGASLDSADLALPAIGASPEVNAISNAAFWSLHDIMKDAWDNRATRGMRLGLRIRTPVNFLHNNVADGYDFVSTEGGGTDRAPQLQVMYRVP